VATQRQQRIGAINAKPRNAAIAAPHRLAIGVGGWRIGLGQGQAMGIDRATVALRLGRGA